MCTGMPAAFGDRRLGSTDVHPAVDGHRVDADDLGVRSPPCEREGERRLARSRRSYEREVTRPYRVTGPSEATGTVVKRRQQALRRRHRQMGRVHRL